MIMNRRSVMLGAGGLAVLASQPFVAGLARAAQISKIGLQLYTVREIFAADPVGTLEQVAKVGYREVEYGGGGYDTMDHALLRKTMDRLGLKSPSIHVGYDALLDNFDASVTMARTLGAQTIVLPYMVDKHRNGPAWDAAIANINRIGEKLKAAGLGFAYHNHDFEFTVKPDGVSLYERLIKGTNPALLKFELDLYWAIYAGQDPHALIRSLPGRIYAYHVKDMRADRSMAAVGAGRIDFASIFKLNQLAGVQHFYVENDQAPAPFIPDITKSFQTLSALRF
ncbi:sugar phosphate isomerase/epimerase [Novosphingobium sp. PhB165]|uniref:sugar phosphate isomerase/epimerase family protein n=1 Tax=Novosphingobium sp. PhB165 TaxID=2485105 RepID=UPI00104CD089|nr:sugar phosphate isomerase/epimerase [Novosphingobium sp. PhB165]TCM22097.1 sugar phosphate isomerase/epimerase [Novosphingobium sp. PhB165]